MEKSQNVFLERWRYQLPHVYIMFPATMAATAVQNVARREILVSFVLVLKFW